MEPSICEEKNFNSLFRDHYEAVRNHMYYKCGDMDQAELAHVKRLNTALGISDEQFQVMTQYVQKANEQAEAQEAQAELEIAELFDEIGAAELDELERVDEEPADADAAAEDSADTDAEGDEEK